MEGYSVHKVIGEGSFGRALLAECKNTQEKYVVKEIQLPKNESKAERCRREAVLLSAMKHAHIVTFHEAFEADHLLCIVMEYCGGGDILQKIQQQKSKHFGVDHILRWFAEMCAGASHIHEKRVLHRDLKSKFQAPSWKSLILKVCRGSYPPPPRHLPPELQLLLRHVFKTDPKERPSLRTILTSHRVSGLLRAHLSPQALEAEQRGRRSAGRRQGDQGKKVLHHLGGERLIDTLEGENKAPPPRRRWAAEPSETVIQVLANASLLSSDGDVHQEERGRRKQWQRDPPERLLSLLEKAELKRAFSTFVIHREGDSPLIGPLSQPQSDDTDGPEQEVHADDERLQPRSDDEDTDFEEDSPRDWVAALEGMLQA
ncbi:serine/threonine-protein kinase Nek3 isoform X2 [Nerophis lumbriciformis]|uniref:serine/threonine-protein kinase Nek3 isoform X2 n=1 Tax=Nerophis lumbriciformis TaxID=546530 RepID=UPI002ADF7D58|nr:serine/threonine-protein kinase Nek3 isoform X2 [Nerophis lumbriciformis]